MHAFTTLFAAFAAAGVALASDQCQNFLGSCSDIQLKFMGDRANDPWLHANGGCGDNNGGKAYGYFELNTKFSNHNGQLVRGDDGNFAYSCDNIRYENGVLTAECGDGNGGTPTSSINLNENICNNNGQLSAF